MNITKLNYVGMTVLAFIFASAFLFTLTTSVAKAAAPDGAGPWADFVVDYNPGLRDNSTPVDPARAIPEAALGVAEDNDTINFVALGFGGDLTLGFLNGIANGAGADFAVTETTFSNQNCAAYPERAMLEVSEDGVTWYVAQTPIGDCQDLTFDIGEVLDEQQQPVVLECINYVRITDTSDLDEFDALNLNHITDGYDVDGIMALHDAGSCTAGEIEVTKTSDADPLGIVAGTEVTYSYEVENVGVIDLDNVDISDDVCSPLIFTGTDVGADSILSPGEVWTYECTMTLDETTTNIVTVTADDPVDNEVTDEAELEVVVKDPTCTLTQGYWKNHHPDGHSKKTDDTWLSLTGEKLQNILWINILWTSPKGGDAWYTLAHQWIAATLNVASDASAPAEVTQALIDGQNILDNNLPGVLTGKAKGDAKVVRQEAISLAGILGSYNEGDIGPGHCED